MANKLKRVPYSISNPDKYACELDLLLEIVSRYENVSVELIKSKSRLTKVLEARKIYMYFGWEMKFTQADVGMEVGRDHATVYHAVQTFLNIWETEPNFKKRYLAIASHIYKRSLKERFLFSYRKYDTAKKEVDLLQVQMHEKGLMTPDMIIKLQEIAA